MHGGVYLKKFAVLFATIICFAMISGSFATTNQNTDKGLLTAHKTCHTLTIVVPVNHSTGYYWLASYNNKKVKLVSKLYVADQPQLIGSGGYNVYKFYGPVGSKIAMNYYEPGNSKVAKTTTYVIK